MEYAQARFIGLFRMLLLVQYADDVPFAVLADVACPRDELLAAPFADEPVVRGHVFRHGGVAVPLPLSFVGRQAFVFVVYLDKAVRVDDLYLFADMLVGHTVVVFVPAEVDMAVLVYGPLCIGPYLVPFRRQLPKFFPLDFQKQ